MRNNLIGMCSVAAAVAVAGSAMASVTFIAGGFGFTGNNVFSVPVSGSPQTVVTGFGIQFSGSLATSLANQNLWGAVAKVEYGPCGMGGFNGGPFSAAPVNSPFNTQYAATRAVNPWTLEPAAGFGYNPSTTLEFALANELNPSPDAWGDPILIKYAVLRNNGSLAYRQSWLGTYAAGAYTFTTVFWASGSPSSTAGGFAGSTWAGNWGDPLNPGLNWSYVYTTENDWNQAAILANTGGIVPAPGAIALLGAAGLMGRRRRA